jgi:hypothetical protein
MLLYVIQIFLSVLALIIFSLSIYGYYYNIHPSKLTSNFYHHHLLRLSLTGGAMVPYGNANPNDIPLYDGATTVVELSDAELNELLQIVFAEIGNSNLISVELLQSLGLYTDTVVSLLNALGYIIF